MPPITPQEAEESLAGNIPEEVLSVFNTLIAAGFSGGDSKSTIRQEDVIKVLVNQGFKRADIFYNGWLNVEPLYRKAGWKVEYDKPAFNESYPATFTFSKR